MLFHEEHFLVVVQHFLHEITKKIRKKLTVVALDRVLLDG